VKLKRRELLALKDRKHGLSTEQFPVSVYVGSSKNLKDLKVAGLVCSILSATPLDPLQPLSPPGRARGGCTGVPRS